ncbi:hypothetical protein XENOCAPTIV_028030, partial [Xenoophorus captivus]
PSVTRTCGTLRLRTQLLIGLCLTVTGWTSCGALAIFASSLLHLYRVNASEIRCIDSRIVFKPPHFSFQSTPACHLLPPSPIGYHHGNLLFTSPVQSRLLPVGGTHPPGFLLRPLIVSGCSQPLRKSQNRVAGRAEP